MMLSCPRRLPPKWDPPGRAGRAAGRGVLRARLYLFSSSSRLPETASMVSTLCFLLCLRLQSVSALKAPRAAECKCLQKLNNSSKIHIMQTSPLFPDDTTWSTKHKQKPTKASAEALWEKNHLAKSFSALLTAIRTVIMLKWLVSPENWINWDTEETIESKETDGKNKWDNRWKAEMQCLNCSCNSASNKHR